MEGTDGPSRVGERLWVGDVIDAKNWQLLNALNISHILNATAEESNFHQDKFCYCQIPLYDRASERAAPFFDDVFDFISSAHAEGGTVMIHCAEGISRSVTLALAYLMRKEHISLSQAFEQMKQVRPEIEPNPGFLQELREFEFTLFGQIITQKRLTRWDLGIVNNESPLEQLQKHVATYIAGGIRHVGTARTKKAQEMVLDTARNLKPEELQSVLPSIIYYAFNNFGGNTVRDDDGRTNLAVILNDITIMKPQFRSVIQKSVASINSDEDWQDFCVDVPRASQMIEELQLRMHEIEKNVSNNCTSNDEDLEHYIKKRGGQG